MKKLLENLLNIYRHITNFITEVISVVLLKESQKRIMIVGVKQKQAGSDKVWDYSACLYPEGILDPDRLFLFDSEQIERLYFVGFQDGEGLAFLENLNHLDD